MPSEAHDRAIELSRRVEERKTAARYASEYEPRKDRWRQWKNRIQESTAMYRGDFSVVFPDESANTERPKVPNVLQLALNDRVNTATSVPLSIRVDKTSEKESEKAEKRERIASFHYHNNRGRLLMPRFFMDLGLTGANFKLVLPDFKTGFPCIKRLDPRFVWPDTNYSPDKPFSDVIIAYQESIEALVAQYPEQAGEILSGQPAVGRASILVDVFDSYNRSEFATVALIPTKNGNKAAIYLGQPTRNRLSRIPIVCAALPTPDGEFRGLFDQVIPVLNAENRLFNMTIDAAVEWIYSGIVEFGISNWQDWGKAVLHADRPDAFMRRMQPDRPAPELFNLLQGMGGNAKAAAAWSEARTGEVQQNIISAAGINSLSAPFNAGVAMDQQLEAASWDETLSLCLEVDEVYLDRKKSITGQSNGRAFSEEYQPSKDIKGSYAVRAEYGGGQGGDRFSYEIRLTQQHVNGLISDETVMENLGVVQDVQKERNRILRERSLKGILALVDQQTAQGNPYPAIKVAQLVANGEDVMQHLEEIAQLVAPTGGGEAAVPPGLPATGTEAFTEAGAIARGGISPQENVPGVGSLPPLNELLVAG